MSQLNVDKVVLTSGMVLPSYTSAQLPAGEQGLLVFDSTAGRVKVYDGSTWKSLNATVAASGGTVTYYNEYKVHTFTGDGTFTVTAGGLVEYLLVGGGAAGGSDIGGGGGAGGFLEGSLILTPGSYTIDVGAGGTNAGTGQGIAYNSGSQDGRNTTAFGLTAIGGGGGGTEVSGCSGAGFGGCGGGMGPRSARIGFTLRGQGQRGGFSFGPVGPHAAGGGGGAGEQGQIGNSNPGGNGGKGRRSNIDGNNYYYAGGGGGGAYASSSVGGTGGLGGGGGAAAYSTVGSGGTGGRNNGSSGGLGVYSVGGNAGANTGSGGGGGTEGGGGGNGGSGIVIVRYLA